MQASEVALKSLADLGGGAVVEDGLIAHAAKDETGVADLGGDGAAIDESETGVEGLELKSGHRVGCC